MSDIPTIARNDENQVECSICSYVIGQPRSDGTLECGVYLPCSHFFGMRCLAHAIVERQNCPICRADIPRHVLIDLLRIGRGLSGSGTGDRPASGGRSWRELDMEEAARDARSVGLRGSRDDNDDEDDDNPLRFRQRPSIRSDSRGSSLPSGGLRPPRERPSIIVRELDANGNIVETPDSPSNYPIDGSNSSLPPSLRMQQPQYEDQYSSRSRDEREDSDLSSFFRERARQFRGRENATSYQTPANLSSRDEQYRPSPAPQRRNALPGYQSPYEDRHRSSPPSLRRPISPPRTGRYGRDRQSSMSSIDSGSYREGNNNTVRSRPGQPTITRTSGGVEIVEITRDLGSLSARDREEIYSARRAYNGRDRELGNDRRALMDRALNDPDYFRRSDRYLSRRRNDDYDGA